MATTKEDHFQVTRITHFIPKPFHEVQDRLFSSIKRLEESGLSILNKLDSKDIYEQETNRFLGPHDFMHFASIPHGGWIKLYDVGAGRQATRLVFGNPQIAITMLKHDLTAGLFVPVETILIEREDGKGTDVVQIKPSTLIAGAQGSSPELKAAAEALDAKLEKLWKWVAE